MQHEQEMIHAGEPHIVDVTLVRRAYGLLVNIARGKHMATNIVSMCVNGCRVACKEHHESNRESLVATNLLRV